ncbi:hypothetical protein CRG98_047389 [Punica granatum]|uniref:Uncharacterized protein n=1 Tax=Punica granatum TaxID=22663 RepID=A0A2I0HKL1_PUNGR|nr:hypothetical protein CRG98_047389 [Punica granatum]
MPLKPRNSITITLMLSLTFLALFFSGLLQFPSLSAPLPSFRDPALLSGPNTTPDPFTDLLSAYKKWDSQVGCTQFRERHKAWILTRTGSSRSNESSSLQVSPGESECSELQLNHASVLVKGWTWIPDNLDNLYACRCGLSCLWTKSPVLADKPDALLFETSTPPRQWWAGPIDSQVQVGGALRTECATLCSLLLLCCLGLSKFDRVVRSDMMLDLQDSRMVGLF